MASKALSSSYDAALKAAATSPLDAIRLYRDIALGSHPNDLESIKVRLRRQHFHEPGHTSGRVRPFPLHLTFSCLWGHCPPPVLSAQSVRMNRPDQGSPGAWLSAKPR